MISVSCGNKRRFWKQAAADKRAAEIAVKDGAMPMRSYWCGACSGWHLTRQKSLVERAEAGERLR